VPHPKEEHRVLTQESYIRNDDNDNRPGRQVGEVTERLSVTQFDHDRERCQTDRQVHGHEAQQASAHEHLPLAGREPQVLLLKDHRHIEAAYDEEAVHGEDSAAERLPEDGRRVAQHDRCGQEESDYSHSQTLVGVEMRLQESTSGGAHGVTVRQAISGFVPPLVSMA